MLNLSCQPGDNTGQGLQDLASTEGKKKDLPESLLAKVSCRGSVL